MNRKIEKLRLEIEELEKKQKEFLLLNELKNKRDKLKNELNPLRQFYNKLERIFKK